MHAMSPAMGDDPATLVTAFERRARRFETPCGSGSLVWHAWGSGPPVLLAHGSHGAWSHWVRNIDALSAERTVWVPDLPGYGESATVPREDQETISAVIATGLRQLIPHELPVDIVGFSFGSIACTHFAARHRALVRRLIVIGMGGLGTPMGQVELRRVRGLEASDRSAALRANLLGLMLHNPKSVDELALYLHELNGFRARLNLRSLVGFDGLLDVLPLLTVQLDAIWGAHDRPHPNPPIQEKLLRRFQPDIDFRVIPDAGHWAMYENSEAFNRTLIDLLNRPLRAKHTPPGQN